MHRQFIAECLMKCNNVYIISLVAKNEYPLTRRILFFGQNIMQTFEVRDYRNKAMFRVDDEYLNGYAKLCGIYATGVYNCLCRHANHLTQASFPSVELMADKLGISRDSVLRGIKALEKWGIIKKEKTRSAQSGKWIHNSYSLVDKSFWVPKPDQVANSDVDNQVANSGSPGRSQQLSQVAHSDTKVAHKKETHNEGSGTSPLVGEIIKLFEVINPACKNMYGNTTQRKACQNLLDTYGFEQVKKVIAFLPKNNSTAYKPKASTPLQLWEKWSDIGNSWKQEESKFTIEKSKYKVAF